jgi:hypothetical protein
MLVPPLAVVTPAVVNSILARLDTQSLGRLGRVSQWFRSATRDPLLWLGTGRITRVSDWHPRALDTYGRYVTVLDETKVTKTARKKLQTALCRLSATGAPLTTLTVAATNLDVVQRYSGRLASVQRLTIVGDPQEMSHQALEFTQPVFVRIVVRGETYDWSPRHCSALAVPVAVVVYSLRHERSVRIIYTENASWSVVDAVNAIGDILYDGGLLINTIHIIYRGTSSPMEAVAERLMASFGERIRDKQFPHVSACFPDAERTLLRVLARLSDGSVVFETTYFGFTTRRINGCF